MPRHGGDARNRVSHVTVIAVTVAALYFAQEVLVPLALAVLLTFVLAPLAARLERRGLGRVVSVVAPPGRSEPRIPVIFRVFVRLSSMAPSCTSCREPSIRAVLR